jgi:phenylpropionate dioxygenase-like ring-hydroxylating dioxygenase large terminal subunit
VLSDIQYAAQRPREEAMSLPPLSYVSDDVLVLEKEKLFGRGWMCVGRTEEMPHPNCFITQDVVGTPVISIRQKDGTIRSFSNVCLHRSSKLVSELRGQMPRVVCPYHAWTYRNDGTLLAAPHMQQLTGFCVQNHALREIRTEVWEGFVYASLDADAPPLAAALQGLKDVYGRYRMAEYITFVHDEETWNANWKIAVENFIEGYHLFRIHPETFEPVSPTLWQAPQVGGRGYMYQTARCRVNPERGERSFGIAPQANTHLEGEWRSTGSNACVFPAHLIQVSPDFLWYMSLQPDGVGRTRIRRGLAVAPERLALEVDHDRFFAETKILFDQVNLEDRVANEAVQTGAASRFAGQGRLCSLEVHMHEFAQYLNRELAA